MTPFAGRQFDVCAFWGQRAAGDARLSADLLADGGRACAGVVKLAQWFVAALLTPKGSCRFDPEYGTDFLPALATGRLRTEVDLYAAFGFAVGDLRSQAKRAEPASAPADERFDDAVLLAAALAPGYARLTVAVRSVAGDARTVILPVPTAGGA